MDTFTLIQPEEPISFFWAIAGAFAVWLIKTSYEKYDSEIRSLRNVEVILFQHIAKNMDNKEFFDRWMQQLKKDRLFVCNFGTHMSHSSEALNISNNSLLNRLIELDHKVQRFDADLQGMFDTYQSSSIRILDADQMTHWKDLNENTLGQALEIEGNFKQLQVETKESIAHLRAYYKQKTFSFFRLIHLARRNIYPRVTKTTIENEIKAIKIPERN